MGWSNSTLNTLEAVEIFITGILTDFTNLKMQRVLGQHASCGTKSIKTVKLAPVKNTREGELLQSLHFPFVCASVHVCVCFCSHGQKYGARIVLLPSILSYIRKKKKPHDLKSYTLLGYKTLGDRRKGLCN